MSLNFIDISSWQAGLDLAAVFAQNPLDGVIVKATEKINYVNPHCDPWVQWCIKNKKPWGFYHFLAGSDPVAEAKFFVKNTINYFHDGLPCADYEGNIVQIGGSSYLKTFLDTVYEETGVKPMVYCSLSTIQAAVNGFRSIAAAGYPLWLAQWAGNYTNFVPNPWQNGSYEPFKKITMHQYTDRGKLNGFSGNLDLDIFYGTVDDWNTLTGKDETQPSPAPDPAPTDKSIAQAVQLLREALDLLINYSLKGGG